VNESTLSGAGVLVTRPRRQADVLVDAIESIGGTAIRFPAIEIRPRPDADVIAEAERLGIPDIAVFVSPNAVRCGLRYAGAAQLAAVGPATARAVEAAGRTADIQSPDGYSSEHLLGTPALQDVSGKVVRIIRGNGGRELLAAALCERGATVEYLEVYSRELPHYTESELAGIADKWRSGAIDIVTVMSVATFDNLVTLLPRNCRDLLARTPLVAPASRVIKAARDRFPDIPTMLASGPRTNDMVTAIVACRNREQPDE
jgi:uroporphyrinogen-III synthase